MIENMPSQINVSRGNLFDIAAKYLGDATLWYQIAALNGMTDPWFYGIAVLKLPRTVEPSNGGILGVR